MKLCSIGILFVLSAFAAAASQAEERGERPTSAVVNDGAVSITSSIDRASASVVEPILLKVVVRAPQGSRVEWPTLDTKIGSLEVTRVTKLNDLPSASDPNSREWVLQLLLESLKAGDVEIPTLDVRVATSPQAELKPIQSSPLQIHISSVLEDRPDPTRFRDIKETVDAPIAPPTSHTWMIWAGGGTAAAVALLLLTIAIRRRNRGPAPAAWALASIADVERMNSADVDIGRLFNEVAEIVREYLQLEFGIDAMSQTTKEFLSTGVDEIDLPAKTTERLKWLASVADEIKFARLDIGSQHFEQAVAQAKALITECDQHRRALLKGAA